VLLEEGGPGEADVVMAGLWWAVYFGAVLDGLGDDAGGFWLVFGRGLPECGKLMT